VSVRRELVRRSEAAFLPLLVCFFAARILGHPVLGWIALGAAYLVAHVGLARIRRNARSVPPAWRQPLPQNPRGS
jgi:hypothetical protein